MRFFERFQAPKPAKLETSPEQEKERNLREQIQTFEAPSLVALEKIRDDIEHGTIGTVIGIDGSGRLPALLIGKIIKSRYQELGHTPIEQKFFRGLTGERNAEDYETQEEKIATLTLAIQRLPMRKERKVLIVDDFVDTGETVIPFLDVLRREGYKVEVLSLGSGRLKDKITIYDSVEWDELRDAFHAGDMSVGSYHQARGDLKRNVTPLHSGGSEDTFISTSKEAGISKDDGDTQNPYSSLNPEPDRNRMIIARDELAKVSNKVLEGYLQKLAIEEKSIT